MTGGLQDAGVHGGRVGRLALRQQRIGASQHRIITPPLERLRDGGLTQRIERLARGELAKGVNGRIRDVDMGFGGQRGNERQCLHIAASAQRLNHAGLEIAFKFRQHLTKRRIRFGQALHRNARGGGEILVGQQFHQMRHGLLRTNVTQLAADPTAAVGRGGGVVQSRKQFGFDGGALVEPGRTDFGLDLHERRAAVAEFVRQCVGVWILLSLRGQGGQQHGSNGE